MKNPNPQELRHFGQAQSLLRWFGHLTERPPRHLLDLVFQACCSRFTLDTLKMSLAGLKMAHCAPPTQWAGGGGSKEGVWPSLCRLLPFDSDLDKWQKMDVWMAFGTVHTLMNYVLSSKPNLVFQGWLCRVKVNTAHLRPCKPISTNLTMYISYIQTFFWY